MDPRDLSCPFIFSGPINLFRPLDANIRFTSFVNSHRPIDLISPPRSVAIIFFAIIFLIDPLFSSFSPVLIFHCLIYTDNVYHELFNATRASDRLVHPTNGGIRRVNSKFERRERERRRRKRSTNYFARKGKKGGKSCESGNACVVGAVGKRRRKG